MRRRIVVVGGGLTGLATAWRLRDEHEVVLLEASGRLGGQVRTVEFAGAPLDVGADALLARRPEGPALLRDAGFADADVVAPAARRVLLWTRGRLRPLPPATVMGVPTDLRATIRSGVLSPSGIVRAALEPLVPRRDVDADRSVADVVGSRFGRDVVDTLVEPLLGGVYAGRADRLSAPATIPSVWDAVRERGRLMRALAEQRRGSRDDDRPVFVTLAEGLSSLVDRLTGDLGARVHVDAEVSAIERTGHAWRVTTAEKGFDADAVVVAVPAAAAASLLADTAPEAARELDKIRTASVGVVALGYDRRDAASVPADVSGLLVPRREGRLVKAVTFSSRKWPQHADRERFVLRASVGRVDDRTALDLDDDTLADRVDAEIRWATGIRAPATERLVARWPDALPQYDVGHLGRVARIRAAIAAAPAGLHLAGAALDGVGIAARAAEASRLASTLRRF